VVDAEGGVKQNQRFEVCVSPVLTYYPNDILAEVQLHLSDTSNFQDEVLFAQGVHADTSFVILDGWVVSGYAWVIRTAGLRCVNNI
jgi:hypothetical protein